MNELEVVLVSENSRMARYHSDEPENPRQQPQEPQQTYQRRPALARWVAILVMLFTLSIGLKVTVFNANYTAGVVSRSDVGQKVVNQLNNELESLGVSGNPVTSGIVQPYLAQGVAQLYGETSTTTIDNTELTNAISTQAQTMGVTATAGMTTALVKEAKKVVQAAFSTSAMSQASAKIQKAKTLDFWLMIATVLLAIVTVIYAFSVHHVMASLGPGLAVGGLLTGVIGAVGYYLLPSLVPTSTATVTSMITTVGRSGIGVIIFAGVAEIVLGLLVMLGHRTFRTN
ncbi:hypothetical protein FD28_GL001489 [Levilactobacillus hammesii DSM 16381]|uniref:Uncharacterized protein n=1 Tax=Levilactobacillus hammesii DSM 16381 TaxID=1423753 RepID=A0A0R1UTF3_9LACO|nr:hypothetical protein FD28_GL001489 [Levilactobacillus hammesii DSM 16381]